MKTIERRLAEKELKVIEYRHKNTRSDFAREMDIWEDIAFNINNPDQSNEEYNLWCLVMDLFKEKYR